MPSLLTPHRRRGVEILDDPHIDDMLRSRSLADVARSNSMFGGARAVQAELELVLDATDAQSVALLDVGTGAGDIPARVTEEWYARAVDITDFGYDIIPSLQRNGRAGERLSIFVDDLAVQ